MGASSSNPSTTISVVPAPSLPSSSLGAFSSPSTTASASLAPTPSSSAPTSAGFSDKFEAKDNARNDRLRRSNSVKNRIWSEWQKQCLKRCDDDVRAFWVCRETQGLMAPVRCGVENEGMKACLQACGRDESGYAVFRERRAGEIESDILRRAGEREQRASAAAAAAAAAAAQAAPAARGGS